jgi:urocanate hydratase
LDLDLTPSLTIDFVSLAENFYAGLVQLDLTPNPTSSAWEKLFGGMFLYVGELHQQGRALVVAGNVAGTATLAATADIEAQKQAVRDGTVDFLVTSLDEALRILKNEIRKRKTVAVCVGTSPEAIESQMLERGVQPDLLGPLAESVSASSLLGPGVKRVDVHPASANQVLISWEVSESPARWMPLLDAIASECLPENEMAARRWLRLAPRYLGRSAQGIRVLRSGPETAKAITGRMRDAVCGGEIGASVHVEIAVGDQRTITALEPPAGPERGG